MESTNDASGFANSPQDFKFSRLHRENLFLKTFFDNLHGYISLSNLNSGAKDSIDDAALDSVAILQLQTR